MIQIIATKEGHQQCHKKLVLKTLPVNIESEAATLHDPCHLNLRQKAVSAADEVGPMIQDLPTVIAVVELSLVEQVEVIVASVVLVEVEAIAAAVVVVEQVEVGLVARAGAVPTQVEAHAATVVALAGAIAEAVGAIVAV